MSFVLKEVSALWPKLDRTYRFDNAEMRSVPCSPTADGAEYTINAEMSPEQAKELHAYCQSVWDDFAKKNKGAEYVNKPYKKNEQGLVVAKAKLKGAYNGEATRKPRVFDSTNQLVADDFKLTTGSTINLQVTAIPYATGMAQGISLRIGAVQVLELAESSVSSPFGEVKGGYTGGDKPFGEIEQPKKVNGSAGALEDDIPFN